MTASSICSSSPKVTPWTGRQIYVLPARAAILFLTALAILMPVPMFSSRPIWRLLGGLRPWYDTALASRLLKTGLAPVDK